MSIETKTPAPAVETNTTQQQAIQAQFAKLIEDQTKLDLKPCCVQD